MSNLYSYFQRIEQKKMTSTITESNPSVRQASPTMLKSTCKTVRNKSQTSKDSAHSSMNMTDVYSADSPKSEKRKQTVLNHSDDESSLNKTKSSIDRIAHDKAMSIVSCHLLCVVERKSLVVKNQSDDDDDDDDEQPRLRSRQVFCQRIRSICAIEHRC
jgi:hypothetical protein